MPPQPTNDILFPTLSDRVKRGHCVAVLGAGVSAPDYPLWPELIETLRTKCELRPEDEASGNPLDVAEVAKTKDTSKYYGVLRHLFARKKKYTCLKRYHLLARINFASIITLNMDPLLLDVIALHRNVTASAYPWLQNEYHGRSEVFFLHGRVDPDSTSGPEIVLSRSDFEQAYDPLCCMLWSFVQQTLLSYDICFLGCNPSEPYLHRLISSCRSIRDGQFGMNKQDPPRWFLLAEEAWTVPPEVAEAGIAIVKYPMHNGSYVTFDNILESWADKKPPEFRTPGAQNSIYEAGEEPSR